MIAFIEKHQNKPMGINHISTKHSQEHSRQFLQTSSKIHTPNSPPHSVLF